MNNRPTLRLDPYQVLFPLGLLHSIIGTALWIGFARGWIDYPGNAHAEHMVPGFLLSFATGFLLTALPRFTGSDPCSTLELAMATSLSAVMLVWPHPPASLALILFLIVFSARRYLRRSYSPPRHFVFLPMGMLLGISGAFLLTLSDLGLLGARAVPAGRLFLYYGPMLAFVIGIGAKLVTALLGWGAGPVVQISPVSKAGPMAIVERIRQTEPTFLSILMMLGFFTEAAGWIVSGRALRAACISLIAFPLWHLHRAPRQEGRLARWLWLSGWMLVIGTWLQAILPDLGIHAAHLYLVGSFGLMALMVASRVTLAHGGYDTRIEIRSRVFTWSGALVLLAAWTRFSAPFTRQYTHHLGYAAFVWIAATLIWGVFFVPRMVRRSPT